MQTGPSFIRKDEDPGSVNSVKFLGKNLDNVPTSMFTYKAVSTRIGSMVE